VPFRRQEITEKGLLGYAGAGEAFERLTQRVDRDQLLRMLCEIPFASPKKQPLVEGVTDRSLRAFPERILAWANEIARVNSSMFLDPKHLPKIAGIGSTPGSLPEPLNLSPEQAGRRAENFQRLPTILRQYADYLREWLPSFKHLGRHGFRPRVLGILILIKLVKDSCGRPHYEQIATLLEAAFAAAGDPKKFEADDLQKLEQNNIMLWALLHPELFSSMPSGD
jgi:hypothetical protein